jgi:hypothetical protein
LQQGQAPKGNKDSRAYADTPRTIRTDLGSMRLDFAMDEVSPEDAVRSELCRRCPEPPEVSGCEGFSASFRQDKCPGYDFWGNERSLMCRRLSCVQSVPATKRTTWQSSSAPYARAELCVAIKRAYLIADFIVLLLARTLLIIPMLLQLQIS